MTSCANISNDGHQGESTQNHRLFILFQVFFVDSDSALFFFLAKVIEVPTERQWIQAHRHDFMKHVRTTGEIHHDVSTGEKAKGEWSEDFEARL